MRIPHPYWRGFFLAAAVLAGLILLGFPDASAAFSGDRRMIAYSGGLAAGAFLGALPGRLRKGARPAQATTWQRCLLALGCGLGMGAAFTLAGGGYLFPALLIRDPGAWGFGTSALAAGFITRRIAERKKA